MSVSSSFSPPALVAFCRRPEIVAGGVFLLALATIVGAWSFQLIGGYIPCELCYQERMPYYVGIPLALVALASACYGGPTWLTRGALLLTALVFAWGTYLAVYHTGAEYALVARPHRLQQRRRPGDRRPPATCSARSRRPGRLLHRGDVDACSACPSPAGTRWSRSC